MNLWIKLKLAFFTVSYILQFFFVHLCLVIFTWWRVSQSCFSSKHVLQIYCIWCCLFVMFSLIFKVMCHMIHFIIWNFSDVALEKHLWSICIKKSAVTVNSNQVRGTCISQLSKILRYFRDKGNKHLLVVNPVFSL